MTTDIDIIVFKDFVRLEDPYEYARYFAKQDILEPFKQQIYVGRINPYYADVPVDPKPSTDICLAQAKTPYELLKLDVRARKFSSRSEESTQNDHGSRTSLPQSTPAKEVKSHMQVRSLLDNHGKWNAYIYQYNREKALKSDAANPLVPKCLAWSVENVIAWVRDIGLEKYEVGRAQLPRYYG